MAGRDRTPVREALARLEHAGSVRTKPGRYTIVSPLDVRAVRNAQSVTAAMHELAVRETLPNLSAAELDAMRAANARFADALRRPRPLARRWRPYSTPRLSVACPRPDRDPAGVPRAVLVQESWV